MGHRRFLNFLGARGCVALPLSVLSRSERSQTYNQPQNGGLSEINGGTPTRSEAVCFAGPPVAVSAALPSVPSLGGILMQV